MKKIAAIIVGVGVGMLLAGNLRAEGDAAAKTNECKHVRGERFAKADVNNDRKLSLEEFKAMVGNKPNAEQKFKAADTDNDGFLTPAELRVAHGKGKKSEKPDDKKVEQKQ